MIELKLSKEGIGILRVFPYIEQEFSREDIIDTQIRQSLEEEL
jgi:hypothetical protein